MQDDVVVVGGGLAGATAAIAAAREGAAVRVLSHKESTLRSASGLVDVLGYLPRDDPSTPIIDPFDAIVDLQPDHPYRVVGVDAVRDALALFDDVVGSLYRGDHTERNALLATFGGAPKPTARYPAAAAAGLLSRRDDVLFVGFETLVDFDAPVAADHLEAADVPFAVRGETLAFPGEFRPDAALTRYVAALDRNEPVTTPAGDRPIRESLGDAVTAVHDGEPRVGFPAILGDDHAEDVRAALEARLDAAVFEVPMGPPSIPGLRLQDAFDAALRAHDVAVETGNPVVDYETDDGRLTAVTVDRTGARLPYQADQFVLATGGLVGRGLETDRTTVREPVFGCHVPHPADRTEWSRPAAFGDHAFARFGVRTDDDLRPLDATGAPAFPNLRAAGAVLGGFDFAAEKSGSGVSLATGRHAGIHAARDL
jgi:glycerol-3-phosphate dehydrogenase subunit B